MCQVCGGMYEDDDEDVQVGWIGCDETVAGGTTIHVQGFQEDQIGSPNSFVRNASKDRTILFLSQIHPSLPKIYPIIQENHILAFLLFIITLFLYTKQSC